MGDPRKLRKKYATPIHPWQKGRIEEENKLIKIYGFKNKQEIWRMRAILDKFKRQIKKLVRENEDLVQKEREELILKLKSLNLLQTGKSSLEDALSIELKDVCERRLQTLVYKKGYARTVKQSRQLIVHEHILVAGKKITAPSYIVKSKEESEITFKPNSTFLNEDHPERTITEKTPSKTPEKKESKQKKKNETKSEKKVDKRGKK